MKRPVIKIKRERTDLIIEIIGFLGLIILIGLPLLFFNKLPETIPIHFGLSGEADGFGDKGILWVLPIVGCVMYSGLIWLIRFPHLYNYPQDVTEANAAHLYKMATRMIRLINTLMSCAFAFLTYKIIQNALGHQSGLGYWFVPVFLILVFGAITYFLYHSMKKQN